MKAVAAKPVALRPEPVKGRTGLDGGSEARAGQTLGAHTLRFLKSPPTSAPPTPQSVTRRAFVSTSSIAHGVQVGVLQGWLQALDIRMHFAHRTFS